MKPRWQLWTIRDGRPVHTNRDLHAEVWYGLRCFPNAFLHATVVSFNMGVMVMGGIILAAEYFK